jgi:benzoate membrane transport protein
VSGALVALVATAPKGALETVAGLALMATLAAALTAALGTAEHRVAGVVTFLVSASGIAIAGVGAAFWALVAGLVVRWVLSGHHPGAWFRFLPGGGPRPDPCEDDTARQTSG